MKRCVNHAMHAHSQYFAAAVVDVERESTSVENYWQKTSDY